MRHPARKPTRRALALWDRLKFIILLVLLWFIVVWYQMSNIPILGFHDAALQQLQVSSGIGRWLVLLLGIEVIRQVSFLAAERSHRYYRAATTVFSGTDRAAHRFGDYSRFRVSRAVKWLVVIAIISVILGAIFQTSPLQGLFRAPASIVHYLPYILYGLVLMLLAVGQFAAIFWFLSRGGVDVYYPGDITTRFGDVWGQDHVLEKVKENILFLEDPESIEEKGGYVPGGILLWGPPGTGKTLMAEAVAGETGKPYVFVDPGAFINMFFGVGVLKVKSLFR
ncbi:MAG: AAA family ATPase [Streptosporangiaceae bacterium]